MRISICGNMKFAQAMIEAKNTLEKMGHVVVVPANVERHADNTINIENKREKMELDLIRSYFEEIKKADAILVINKDKNNISNYIGGNSLIEISFAYVLHKKIFLLNPIPKINYSDEIEAMSPIIINNDLKKIQ